MVSREELEELARIVVDCGFHLHRDLGPGLLESAYETLMFELLRQRGIAVARQVPVPLEYAGIHVESAFRADLIAEGSLLIELKSVERSAPVHAKQVLTYLRLLNLPVGLLINFGLPTFKDGIQRIINGTRR